MNNTLKNKKVKENFCSFLDFCQIFNRQILLRPRGFLGNILVDLIND